MMKTRSMEELPTEKVGEVAEGLRQAEARLLRTIETLRATPDGRVSRGLLRRASEQVQQLMDAHPGGQPPEIAEALDAIDVIGDTLLAMADEDLPTEDRSRQREIAWQFQPTLPPFSGRPDDLEWWKAILVTRMRTAGVSDPEIMFGVIADGQLLPDALRWVVRNVRTWAEFWGRLDRAIPFRDVRLAVWDHLASLKPLGDVNSRSAVAEFRLGLDNFIYRCEERGWTADLASRGLVEFVLDRMGPAIRERYFFWEDIKHDPRTTDLKRLSEFMVSYYSALRRDL